MANPVLEIFRESPKACVTNSGRPPEKLKGKENPDLPLVCSNYWPPNVALSLYFNHLVLSTFQQSMSAIPKRSVKPIASSGAAGAARAHGPGKTTNTAAPLSIFQNRGKAPALPALPGTAPLASIHHTVQCHWRNPCLTELITRISLT